MLLIFILWAAFIPISAIVTVYTVRVVDIDITSFNTGVPKFSVGSPCVEKSIVKLKNLGHRLCVSLIYSIIMQPNVMVTA